MRQWKNIGTGEIRESASNPGTMSGGIPSQPGLYNNGMDVANWVPVEVQTQSGNSSGRVTSQKEPFSVISHLNDPEALSQRLGHELADRYFAKSMKQRNAANLRLIGIVMTVVFLIFLSVKTSNAFIVNLILSLLLGFGAAFAILRLHRKR